MITPYSIYDKIKLSQIDHVDVPKADFHDFPSMEKVIINSLTFIVLCLQCNLYLILH